MKEDEFVGPAETEQRITEYLRRRHGVVCLGGLGFENAYAMAMPNSGKRSQEFRHVRTVADLAEILRAAKRPLRLAGDMQFFERPEWRRVRELYRLEDDWFRTVPMDPTRMYDAVVDGQVEAIVAYSSDGRIPEYQLDILQDPAGAFPQYHAVLLVSRRGALKPRLTDCLQQLVSTISQQDMQEANRQVDVHKRSARTAAEELLEQVRGRAPLRRARDSETQAAGRMESGDANAARRPR
jgi:osmoprotectant transport system permease protein